MNHSSRVCLLALVAVCAGLVGCASTRPVPYSGVASSPQLKPNAQDESGRIPYAYSAETNWQSYASIIVDPVVIYDGADNQFKKITEAEKQVLAEYLRAQVCEKLQPRYRIVNNPGADTLRVKLTLTGANPTVMILGTFTRMDLTGLLINVVQSARSKEGVFTGSVSFAVEISDAATDRLLGAYVEKQYPNAMNIKATLGKWAAAKTGILKGAEDLAAHLQGS